MVFRMTDAASQRRSVYIPDEVWHKLRLQALENGTNVSDLIRKSLENADKMPKVLPDPDVLAAALSKHMPEVIRKGIASMGNHHHFELTNDQVSVTVNNPPVSAPPETSETLPESFDDPALAEGFAGFTEAITKLIANGKAPAWMYRITASKTYKAWKDQHAKD